MSQHPQDPPLPLDELLRAIAATQPTEFDCEQFLDHLALFLESAGPTKELPPEIELVAQHLEACPECREEYDALLRGDACDGKAEDLTGKDGAIDGTDT